MISGAKSLGFLLQQLGFKQQVAGRCDENWRLFAAQKKRMCPQQSNSDYHSHHSDSIIVIEFNDYHVIIDECIMCIYIYMYTNLHIYICVLSILICCSQLSIYYLVGGFNHLEKYSSMGRIIPYIMIIMKNNPNV